MDYYITRVSREQIPNIAKLASLIWGKKSPSVEEMFRKFNTICFGSEYIGYVAYPRNVDTVNGDESMPAAYYGVYPIISRFDGCDVLCAQSGDTMTHPQHRGKGLFIELAQRTYLTASNEGINFVFGFPSPSSYPGFSKKLNWVFPYEMLKFTKYVPTLPIGLLMSNLDISTGSRHLSHTAKYFVERFFNSDELSSKNFSFTQKSVPFASIVRDKRMWDYKSDSVIYAEYEGVGIILKYDGNISIGDIIGSPNSKQVARIIRKLDLIAMFTGSNLIRSYFSPTSRVKGILSPFGNLKNSLPFGFINFNSKYNPSDLDLTFFDYDTF